jgi:hypothetical protein
MVGGLSQGGISRVRANHLLTSILTTEVSFGSNPAVRRVRCGWLVWVCKPALPLATPVVDSMTWSRFRPDGLRPEAPPLCCFAIYGSPNEPVWLEAAPGCVLMIESCGQRRGAGVGFGVNTSRTSGQQGTPAECH